MDAWQGSCIQIHINFKHTHPEPLPGLGGSLEKAVKVPLGLLLQHAPKALELVQKALSAVKELRALETQMDQEGTEVNAHYNTVISEFKLTFEVADSDLADEMDHEFTGLEDCEEALEDVFIDALAACPEELAD
jgi:hypothetical protein